MGEYHTSFTGQGRVVLPKKFRQELEGSKVLILSRGFEGCIWGFSETGFKSETEKQLAEPVTDKKAREIRRYLFSAAESVCLDDQGRFVIPKGLLIYAGLRDRVAIIGAGDYFEIWNPKKWQELIKNITKV